jgi:RNA polymerase sigma-70 factor (ECF subfamily)
VDQAKNPSEAALAAEELRRAEQLLGRLPDAQAEVVRLRVFDELRLSEIAQIVGCSVNTVCSRLRYGFQKLRGLVSREQG